MNKQETIKAIRALGLTARVRVDEWRVNFKGAGEETAYYTSGPGSADDALQTARKMAEGTDALHRATRPSAPPAPAPEDADDDGLSPALREEFHGAVSELVEPEGEPHTHYALTLGAMWDCLNVWASYTAAHNKELDRTHGELMQAIRAAQTIARKLDKLVEDIQ